MLGLGGRAVFVGDDDAVLSRKLDEDLLPAPKLDVWMLAADQQLLSH
jgi:hypothetical protein